VPEKVPYTYDSQVIRYNRGELKKILTDISNDGWEIFSVSPYTVGSDLWVFVVYRKLQKK